MRGGQQQRQYCVAGLVIQMEAVTTVSELVRHRQYVGEGRTLSKCHCPLQTEVVKTNVRAWKAKTLFWSCFKFPKRLKQYRIVGTVVALNDTPPCVL